ncbi:MAG: 50S ribosomal protein L4 [Desulfurococcaceae archaeon]|jgi:large subunit ribosomal protein L4e|nr:50S ribosomal protein L4 [Desulfurococcaceae archaeon]
MRVIVVPTKLAPKRVPVYNLGGGVVSEVELPEVFSLPVRLDIIRRAFHAAFTARLQPKGRDELAGKRRVGESWGINYSVARVPRLDNGRAVFVPQARGGRLAFPPTTERRIHELVNRKEKLLAIASALAATAVEELVRLRGHRFSVSTLPIVVANDLEEVERASTLKGVLKALKVWEDVERAQNGTKIRAGKGKMRGRRYYVPKSLLLVVSRDKAKVIKAGRSLPGVDVVSADMLSILHLAPGGRPGRLTILTLGALEVLRNRFQVVTS